MKGQAGGIFLLIAVVLFGGALVIGAWAIGTYNGLVGYSQAVDSQWANVQSTYQRRADLIPNLVSTVKGYMKHESGTLEAVTAARSQWGAAKTPEAQITAGNAMDSAISRLLVVAENYPELKASESTSKLMDELAGSENRVSVERMRYNEAVKTYNAQIKYVPASIIAGMGGFTPKPYFEAAEGTQNAPKVSFD